MTSILMHELPRNDHSDWLLDDRAIMQNITQMQQIMEYNLNMSVSYTK